MSKKLRTPIIMPRKQGGTFYTFGSAMEDIGLNLNNTFNRVEMSHYVLLDLPKFVADDFSVGCLGFADVNPDNYDDASVYTNKGDYIFADEFQNYVLNMETVLRNQDSYNFSSPNTVSERVFWKWLFKELRDDSTRFVNDGIYYYENQNVSVAKGFGLISSGTQRTDDSGIYNETFVQIPSSYGQMKVLFKKVVDENYQKKNYIGTNGRYIENIQSDEYDSNTGILNSTGISAIGISDRSQDPLYKVGESEWDSIGNSFFEVEFDIANLRKYYEDDSLTYDDIGMGKNPKIPETYKDFTFNAILVYYSIYNSDKTKRLATNAYGLYILDNSLEDSESSGYYYFPRLVKTKADNNISGTSYSFRLNIRPSSAYSGNITISDNSTAAYGLSTDFTDVIRNLSSAINSMKSNTKYLASIVQDNNDIKQMAMDAIEKVNEIEKTVGDILSNGDGGEESSKIVNNFITEEYGNVLNNPDNEDLYSVNNVLKFNDKKYLPSEYSGLGRKYLRKNIIHGENTMEQSMFDSSSTIYHIQYDYDLGGQTVTIPERCILKFDGGSIKNGVLVGNDTIIDTGKHSKIFRGDLITSGTFQSDCYVDWFGANSNASHTESDSASIQAALDSAFEIIKFNAGFYNIDNTIVLRYLKKIESVPNNGGENWNNNIGGTVFRVNSNIDCFKVQLETMAHSYTKRLNLRFGTFLISAQTYNSNVLTIVMPNRELWNSNIEISAVHPLKSSVNASLNDIDNRGTVVRFVDSSPVGGGMYIISLNVNAFGFKEVLSESVSQGLISNVNLTGFAHSCGRIVNSNNVSLFSHGYIKMLCQTGCLFTDETHATQYPWISGILANCHIDCAFWDTSSSFNKGRHMINIDLTKAFYGVTLSQQSYKGPVTAYKNLANIEQKRTQPRSTYILGSNIQNLPNDFTDSFVKKIDNALLDWHNKGFIQNVTVLKTNLIYNDDTISDDIFKNAFNENGCKVPIEIEDADDVNSTSLEITYQINWSNDSTSRIRELIIHRNGYGYVFNKCELTLFAADGTTVLEKETYIYHAEPNVLDSDILASIKLNKSNKTRPGFINLKFSDFVIVTSSQSYKNFHLFIEGSIGSNNTPNIQMNRVCSANRPTFTKLFTGVCVFDTTINKPIWWNGTCWVDSNGLVLANL